MKNLKLLFTLILVSLTEIVSAQITQGFNADSVFNGRTSTSAIVLHGNKIWLPDIPTFSSVSSKFIGFNGTKLITRTAAQVLSDIGGASSSSAITSVSGTSNRITSTGGLTPVIDISASYVGQSSLTTLGTITTGVWNGTSIANANLANSSVTIGSTSVSLGTTVATFAGINTLTTTGTNPSTFNPATIESKALVLLDAGSVFNARFQVGTTLTGNRIFSVPNITGTMALIDGGQTFTAGVWNGTVIGSNYGGAGSINGLLKANGSGVVSLAVAGTDYAAATGSTAYIQNQNASPQTANGWISGDFTVVGSITSHTNLIATSSAVNGTDVLINNSSTGGNGYSVTTYGSGVPTYLGGFGIFDLGTNQHVFDIAKTTHKITMPFDVLIQQNTDIFRKLTIGQLTAGTPGTDSINVHDNSSDEIRRISPTYYAPTASPIFTGTVTIPSGAVLNTPASGTVTNLTGTASININGTVGATTPTTGAFTIGTFKATSGNGSVLITGSSGTTTATLGLGNVVSTYASLVFDNSNDNVYLSSLTNDGNLILKTNSATALTIGTTQVATFASGIATADIISGTGPVWRLSSVSTIVTPTLSVNYINVSINGVAYKIATLN